MGQEQFAAIMPYISAALEQEDTKVWQYSTDMLYSLLEQEERTGEIEFPDV